MIFLKAESQGFSLSQAFSSGIDQQISITFAGSCTIYNRWVCETSVFLQWKYTKSWKIMIYLWSLLATILKDSQVLFSLKHISDPLVILQIAEYQLYEFFCLHHLPVDAHPLMKLLVFCFLWALRDGFLIDCISQGYKTHCFSGGGKTRKATDSTVF